MRKGVDVEAAVGLVEDGELGLEHGHLENLVALFFSAREPFVDAAVAQASSSSTRAAFSFTRAKKSLAAMGSRP